MPVRPIDHILAAGYPDDFRQGAENAIGICLHLAPGELCTIITDEATLPIGASLADAVHRRGNPLTMFVLEDFGPRPMTALPEEILASLSRTDVSVYACRAQAGELAHRIGMMRLIDTVKPRHGHMVNINARIMVEGMRADFEAVDRLSTRLHSLAVAARIITATTPRGTDLTVQLSPTLRWLKTSGIITREKWGNLPGGEIFTSPARVDGVFVVDGVVGDWLCEKYGDLRDTPLHITIENSRIVSTACANNTLLEDFRAYTRTDENSNRVGEFAIGTNIALTGVIGHILQDEKIPGVHIAFGHPYTEHTGADWRSTTHIDVVARNFDIAFDGHPVMRAGVFLDFAE